MPVRNVTFIAVLNGPGHISAAGDVYSMNEPMDSITTVHTDERDRTRAGLLRTLAYFDVFDHPLSLSEILRFADVPLGNEQLVGQLLDELVSTGALDHHAGYWTLRDGVARVHRRELSTERAQARFPQAERMTRRIASFPFVRAVFISGSLSKGCMAPDGDIDYFIITRPGRLWVARTLLILYKKFFLLNSRRDFCVNYFVDTEHLTVNDRDRYTALEVVTLIPLYGNGTTEAFFDRNAWAFAHYPGTRAPHSKELPANRPGLKRWFERALNGRAGDLLDALSMELTWRFWRWKFDHLDPKAFDQALRTRTYVSKHHPRDFRHKVLDGYERRMRSLEHQLGASLR